MDPQEPSDHHTYSWIMLYADMVHFLLRALKFYHGHLVSEQQAFEADPDLAGLVSDDSRRNFGLYREVAEVERVTLWLEEKIERGGAKAFDYDISMSHGMVRYLKSVGSLYLQHLRARRNALSLRANLSTNTLESIDTEITRFEERLDTGVFGNATMRPLLVDEIKRSPEPEAVAATPETARLAHVPRPPPVIMQSIEVLDPELRERCLDLFHKFADGNQLERLDTVVAEAGRILEDRLRRATKATDGATGRDLTTRAFTGPRALFEISTIKSEQEAAGLLFMGAFGYIRNPTQHKLRKDLSAQRVVQIVGFIDYLISLLEAATPREDGRDG